MLLHDHPNYFQPIYHRFMFSIYIYYILLYVTNGKNLVGKFYANDGLIKDNFIIEKSVDKNFDDEKIPNNGVPNLNAISYSEKM